MARLTDSQRSLLEFLAANREYQFNAFAIPREHLSNAHDLPRLKQRGLIDGEGRGMMRQWWITDAGIKALEGE